MLVGWVDRKRAWVRVRDRDRERGSVAGVTGVVEEKLHLMMVVVGLIGRGHGLGLGLGIGREAVLPV